MNVRVRYFREKYLTIWLVVYVGIFAFVLNDQFTDFKNLEEIEKFQTRQKRF